MMPSFLRLTKAAAAFMEWKQRKANEAAARKKKRRKQEAGDQDQVLHAGARCVRARGMEAALAALRDLEARREEEAAAVKKRERELGFAGWSAKKDKLRRVREAAPLERMQWYTP